jgi:gluconolactonase
MNAKTWVVLVWCIFGSIVAFPRAAQEEGVRTPESVARRVTITEIPGVIAPGARWEHVWQGLDNADGIVGMPDGSVLFAQEQASIIRKLDLEDYDSAFVKNTEGAGAVTIDYRGRLVAAQKTCTDPGRGALPCETPTKIGIVYPEHERRVIVDTYAGKPLTRPSEAVVDKNDTVYFTDDRPYYIKPGGEAIRISDTIRASGIMLSPDERILYVGSGSVIFTFDIEPDGTVAHSPREFARLEGGNGNAMAIDAAGRLYVTSGNNGVQVFSPEGGHLGTIPTPRGVVAAAFAGPEKKTLYVVGRGALAPNGRDYVFADGFRNNGKTIYKIPMIAQGYRGRSK